MPAKQSVLLVFARGGPPLEYAVPRIAARNEVHLLIARKAMGQGATAWRELCASVATAGDRSPQGEELVELIAGRAKEVRADAIITFSEFVLMAVAEAARRLGLRSSGVNTALSRDKRLMREAWHRSGVGVPRFERVSSAAELAAAFQRLEPPVLLKSAWLAGSIGQRVISSAAEIPQVWAEANEAVAKSHTAGVMELQRESAVEDFLVEEIIRGTARGWWPDGSGYGDYLSVEGLVVDGTYHPLCATSRIPTIEPFTELANLAPCALPEALQRSIESAARSAVGALGLETCATHTELKLMENGGICVIESAARLAGNMIAAEIEDVFGLDLVRMLTDALLGWQVDLPEKMLTDAAADGAAGSLALIATDSAGAPWPRQLVWRPDLIDWGRIVSPGTRIQAVPGMTVPAGSPIPRYDVSGGVFGYGGVFYLRTDSIEALVRDCYSVLDSMEAALLTAEARARAGDGRAGRASAADAGGHR